MPKVKPTARDRAAVRRRIEAWLRWLPALLLVVVALHQIHLVERRGLSPWSGGGFGMFSTPDAAATRHLHVFVLRPGLEREVAVPDALEDALRRALALPTDDRLRALGRALAELPTPDHGPATGVRIQVWGTEHAGETLEPKGRLIRALEWAL